MEWGYLIDAPEDLEFPDSSDPPEPTEMAHHPTPLACRQCRSQYPATLHVPSSKYACISLLDTWLINTVETLYIIQYWTYWVCSRRHYTPKELQELAQYVMAGTGREARDWSRGCLIRAPDFKIGSSSVQSLSLDCNTPGFPVHHQFLELAQTPVYRVSDAIQPSHPLSSPSPPAFNPSRHQGLFQWVSSLHQVAKVLELQH